MLGHYCIALPILIHVYKGLSFFFDDKILCICIAFIVRNAIKMKCCLRLRHMLRNIFSSVFYNKIKITYTEKMHNSYTSLNMMFE